MMSQSSAPLFNEFKKQASFYIKEKIKIARLALTDVTPAQLMTEEATSGNQRPPDTRTMAFISRAAFEVDDYYRIVEILHARLANFERRNWRPSYNALIVLEHLMTHGPVSIAEDFQDDKESIEEMRFFQHIDEKGFNWSFAVKKKAERLLELLDKGPHLKEERNRVRKVTREIQGFGSFSERILSSTHAILQESKSTYHDAFGRSHSQFNEHGNQEDNGEKTHVSPTVNFNITSPNSKENLEPISSDNAKGEVHVWSKRAMAEQNPLLGSERVDAGSILMDLEDHPFNQWRREGGAGGGGRPRGRLEERRFVEGWGSGRRRSPPPTVGRAEVCRGPPLGWGRG